jgi:hypothetical protein
MSNGYDCSAEAEAAMKKAAATACPYDRLKWVRIAEAWQDLGRHEAQMMRIALKVPSPRSCTAGVTPVARDHVDGS